MILKKLKEFQLRWPGIEPGSTAWKATMLTTIPPTRTSNWKSDKYKPLLGLRAGLAGLSFTINYYKDFPQSKVDLKSYSSCNVEYA